MAKRFLFVPGIGGTEMWRQKPAFVWSPEADMKRWVNYMALTNPNFEQHFTLGPDGIFPDPDAGIGALIPRNLITWFYQPFCDAMRSLGWDPIAAGHDWRWTIARNAENLRVKIEGTYLKYGEPLKIVAHSRGCLVTAAAVELMRTAGTLEQIDRVISLGGPYRGAWAVAPWLAGEGWDFGPGHLELFAVAPVIVKILPIPQYLFKAAWTWPALYELLVDPAFGDASGDNATARLYEPSLYADHGIGINTTWLAAAKARWAAWTAPYTGVKVYCIAGKGYETPRGPFIEDNFPKRNYLAVDKQGDQTVPVASARLPGKPGETLVGESHCGMLNSNNVRVHVGNLLEADDW